MHVRIVELDGGWIRTSIARSTAPKRIAETQESARATFTGWPIGPARNSMCAAEGRVAVLPVPAAGDPAPAGQARAVAVANDVAGIPGGRPGLVLDRFRKAEATERREDDRAAEERPLRHDERMLLSALLTPRRREVARGHPGSDEGAADAGDAGGSRHVWRGNLRAGRFRRARSVSTR